LTAAVMKMGEAIYKDAGAAEDGAEAPEGADASDDDEEIVDAEFEDVDEDKS